MLLERLQDVLIAGAVEVRADSSTDFSQLRRRFQSSESPTKSMEVEKKWL